LKALEGVKVAGGKLQATLPPYSASVVELKQ
jgi:hypothetical protein